MYIIAKGVVHGSMLVHLNSHAVAFGLDLYVVGVLLDLCILFNSNLDLSESQIPTEDFAIAHLEGLVINGRIYPRN